MTKPANDIVDSAADEELVEVVPELYVFVADDDQRLRCFITETMADADIAGEVMVENMEFVYQWVKNGTVPKTAKKKAT